MIFSDLKYKLIVKRDNSSKPHSKITTATYGFESTPYFIIHTPNQKSIDESSTFHLQRRVSRNSHR